MFLHVFSFQLEYETVFDFEYEYVHVDEVQGTFLNSIWFTPTSFEYDWNLFVLLI
jgi:hypothetical protein